MNAAIVTAVVGDEESSCEKLELCSRPGSEVCTGRLHGTAGPCVIRRNATHFPTNIDSSGRAFCTLAKG